MKRTLGAEKQIEKDARPHQETRAKFARTTQLNLAFGLTIKRTETTVNALSLKDVYDKQFA